MIHLIPQVQSLRTLTGHVSVQAVCLPSWPADKRLCLALSDLPQKETALPLTLQYGDAKEESYTLLVEESGIAIQAPGPAGAFYAIQTLKQLMAQGTIPCLVIEDEPSMAYRGFYQDATRGRIATVDALKRLIDRMASLKLNSLQLYVEHVYEFRECRDMAERTGYYSSGELRELDQYCADRFIDFIPSLSTFGHMYEILEQPSYQHLRTLSDYRPTPNYWNERMGHHTIDPTKKESEALVQSLIDQYAPNFSSPFFNICCDETFDLKALAQQGWNEGQLYLDFVQKIIRHVQSHGKTIMMWADILLQHPECIQDLPQDCVFLNWHYEADPPREAVERFASLGRPQIVCPGTSSWSRFMECFGIEESNITQLAAYGHEFGALGLLNTNWGDWGNPASLEMALYGLTLGAQCSWYRDFCLDDHWYASVDALIYEKEGACKLLRRVSDLHDRVSWSDLCRMHYQEPTRGTLTSRDCSEIHREACKIRDALSSPWGKDEIRQALCLALDAVCLMAALLSHQTPTAEEMHTFVSSYETQWKASAKMQELQSILTIFLQSASALHEISG